ncbi:MAG: hypothetical protein KDE26_27095 [Bacteroidetes bacterium]|nr:hypothetical protein [Bacteroidota bacterium]MCB9344410.1 hypothetical protein [Lewinellaceae bacterium]
MRYIVIVFLAMLASCQKDKGNYFDPRKPIIRDVGLDIFVENNKGENLLSPATANYIDWKAIRLFYLMEDQKVEIYDLNMDCPRNICLLNELNSEWIRVIPYFLNDEEYPITYIEWNEFDTDTIQCHFLRENNGSIQVCDQVWLNGSQVYPGEEVYGVKRSFKVIK